MRVLTGIAYTGAAAIVLHPLRSFVTTICLMVVLVPFLLGIGISKGIERDARLSLEAGADLYVSGMQFGKEIALPQDLVEVIRPLEGVADVFPRIVGPITLGRNNETAVVVGIPLNRVPKEIACVDGRLFQESDVLELVLGSELAKRLKIQTGDLIPPFYHSHQGERVGKIVGIFRSDVTIWQSRLVLTSLESAQRIFDQPGGVTELLVTCRTGYTDSVREQIERALESHTREQPQTMRARIVSRDELEARLPRNVLHREGIFNLHFALMFIVGIFVILVTSGMGLPERRREVGILKAVGWQTDEVLLRHFVESLLLGLLAASASILVAFVWLRWLNGFWIASVMLVGVDIRPSFRVPFVLAPIPALLTLIISLVLIMTGTLIATWRAATVPPREAMR